jgi:GGDEF domain-containing protein
MESPPAARYGGHQTGDRLLVEAALRLREALRPSDAAALVSRRAPSQADGPLTEAHPARLGGDEFTVLLPDLRGVGDVLVVARRIGDSLRRPFVIDGHELAISASIGGALFPENGRDAATLLMHADAAMYEAKRAGHDNARLYRSTLAPSTSRQEGLDPHPGKARAELDIGA